MLVACQSCDLTINPIAYVTNPCDCHSYYQCTLLGGLWNAVQRPCPPCLCFDTATLSCSKLANASIPLTDPSCQAPTTTTVVSGKNQMRTDKRTIVWLTITDKLLSLPMWPKPNETVTVVSLITHNSTIASTVATTTRVAHSELTSNLNKSFWN
jgi:hypothetical protein